MARRFGRRRHKHRLVIIPSGNAARRRDRGHSRRAQRKALALDTRLHTEGGGMNHILKVFCSGAEQKDLASKYNVIAQYEGFLVVEADEAQRQEIARSYPTEDITPLYEIRLDGKTISADATAPSKSGKVAREK